MMSMAGGNSANALPDPISVIVRIVSVGAEAVSLILPERAGSRSATDSLNAKVVTGTSGTVPVVAFGVTTKEADFTILGSSVQI